MGSKNKTRSADEPSADARRAAAAAEEAAKRTRTGVIVAAAITVGGGVVVALINMLGGQKTSPPPPSSSVTTPVTTSVTTSAATPTTTWDGTGVETVVTNTWEESVGRLVGVYFYPSLHNNLNKERGVDEGTKVRVICQERHGRRVTDTPYNGRQTESTVWDKLSNGMFISDIYTQLPKVDGDTPPDGLPKC
jgi:hypothetical protein